MYSQEPYLKLCVSFIKLDENSAERPSPFVAADENICTSQVNKMTNNSVQLSLFVSLVLISVFNLILKLSMCANCTDKTQLPFRNWKGNYVLLFLDVGQPKFLTLMEL